MSDTVTAAVSQLPALVRGRLRARLTIGAPDDKTMKTNALAQQVLADIKSASDAAGKAGVGASELMTTSPENGNLDHATRLIAAAIEMLAMANNEILWSGLEEV